MMVYISRNPECIARQEQPNDELLIVQGGTYRAVGPIETTAQRKAGEGTFDFTDLLSEGTWELYLFFASANRKNTHRISTFQFNNTKRILNDESFMWNSLVCGHLLSGGGQPANTAD